MNTLKIIILLLLFLLLFLSADYLQLTLTLYLEESIESFPLTIFVYDEQLLDEVCQMVQEREIVASLTAETNLEILAKMSKDYGLTEVRQLIDSKDLPHVIRIDFSGRDFRFSKFLFLLERIEAHIGNRGVVVSAAEQLEPISLRLQLLRRLNYVVRTVFLVALLLMVYAVNKNSLYRSDAYWKAYRRAGGAANRYLRYSFAALFSHLLPFVIFAGLLCSAQSYIDYSFDIKLWFLMLGLIVSAHQAAWIIHQEV